MIHTTDRLLAHVAVVVLCHDRLAEVRRTVPARIADVHAHGLELIVVDNASGDGTGEWLSDLHRSDPCFVLVLNDRNLGVGAGRNSGWMRASRPVVVTVDEDTLVGTDQLRRMADELERDGALGIVHPVTVSASTGRPIAPVIPFPHRSTNFQGACYAIHRRALDAAGMHDPLCDFGGEELDLSIRVRAAGFDVRQLVDLRVTHPPIVRSVPQVRWRRERWTRNHARVVWRWFPARHALPWSLLMLLGELRAAIRRGAVADVPGLAAAWMAGVRDGRSVHTGAPLEVVRFYRGRLGVLATLRRLHGGRP